MHGPQAVVACIGTLARQCSPICLQCSSTVLRARHQPWRPSSKLAASALGANWAAARHRPPAPCNTRHRLGCCAPGKRHRPAPVRFDGVWRSDLGSPICLVCHLLLAGSSNSCLGDTEVAYAVKRLSCVLIMWCAFCSDHLSAESYGVHSAASLRCAKKRSLCMQVLEAAVSAQFC